VRFACLLPGNRFSGYRFNAFRRAAAFYPKLDRSLVTAFSSPATASAFTDSIPRSMVLACYFAVSPAGFRARSVFPLHRRNWFAPIPAASTLQTRCTSTRKLIRPLSPSPLPFGSFTSLWIKAFNGRCCRPVRLPNPPDFRSLPATVLFLEEGHGSSFAIRYVFGGLLHETPPEQRCFAAMASLSPAEPIPGSPSDFNQKRDLWLGLQAASAGSLALPRLSLLGRIQAATSPRPGAGMLTRLPFGPCDAIHKSKLNVATSSQR
jgi:hypothetical protein